MKKFFNECKSIEELKKAYFKMAMENHPDKGGDTELMKVINNAYAEMQKKLKNVHQSMKDAAETYTAKESTKEVPEDFINIVNALFGLDGLDVELCGRWLWIGGDTKAHKDALKALGCKWSAKKKLWSWHYPEDAAMKYKGKKAWDMNKVRDTFGSMHFEKEDENKRLAY